MRFIISSILLSPVFLGVFACEEEPTDIAALLNAHNIALEGAQPSVAHEQEKAPVAIEVVRDSSDSYYIEGDSQGYNNEEYYPYGNEAPQGPGYPGPGPGYPAPHLLDDDLYPEDDFYFYNQPPFIGTCGNGIREGEEQCDDGNTDNNDGCNILCKLPFCGNGVTEGDEQCDDGNTTNGDGCSGKCMHEACGNGVLDANEECDDANVVNGDGCSKVCMREFCGNSMIDPGEDCDDGNVVDADGCSRFCQIEICGNGVNTPNEECDDGNVASGDGCSSLCTIEVP